MSITQHNGSITLTSLAELGSVIDRQSLPPGPDAASDGEPPQATQETPADISGTTHLDLATLIAQLANVSSGLESMARQDAHARDQAALELAQYEALLAEQQDAERALREARRLRAAAEQLAAHAFSDEARVHAAHHAAVARAAELSCTQLLADRARAAEDLAGRPHLARALADRRRLAQEQAEAAERARSERAARLSSGLVAIDDALAADRLDQARRLLEPLAREFADDARVRTKVDVVRWRLRQRQIEPAETALRDALRRPYRDDPEAAVARLAEINMDGLPDDLARRVFGLWSNACARAVQQRGWLEPRRHAPLTSRGMVFARPTADDSNRVASVLGVSDYQPGDPVTDQRVIRASRPLEAREVRR